MKTLTLLLSPPLLLIFLIECFPGSGPQSWRHVEITAAATTQSQLPTGPTAVQLPSSHSCHWAQKPLLGVSSSANKCRQLFFFSIYKHTCAFHTFIITPLYSHSIFYASHHHSSWNLGLERGKKKHSELAAEKEMYKTEWKDCLGIWLTPPILTI